MLKWTQKGAQGKQKEDTNKMPFLRSKKSFKTTPAPPSQTKTQTKTQPSPAAPPQPSNGSTKVNGTPPSPSNSHTSTHSGDTLKNPGQRTLEITLPNGSMVTATVDANLQMMDLLVNIAATNKIIPTGHVIITSGTDRTDISQFKASRKVGELNSTKLQIVPKLSRGEIQSIKGSEKKKAAQFEETIRLTVITGKNHKALFRVNPDKPIQDFLPQIYEERGIEAHECRLRLVKNEDEDIDYSKSLNYYGGINELVLVDLRPPPTLEAEPAPIEKKKKSLFARKKKKGEAEPESEKTPVVAPQKDTVVATSPPEAAQPPPQPQPQPQPVKPTTSETTEAAAADSNAHKKRRRAAPPPPPGAKKDTAPQENGHVQKTSVNNVSKAPTQGAGKKRRAPAPPPPGGAQAPQTAPAPAAQTLDLLDGEEIPPPPSEKPPPPPDDIDDELPPPPVEFDFVFGTKGEVAVSEAEKDSAELLALGETPDSTLERQKDEEKDEEKEEEEEKEKVDALEADDVEVTLNLAELDAVLEANAPTSDAPIDTAEGPLPPPPVFVPPPPPDEPPSPDDPREDLQKLVEEGRLVLSPGGGEGGDSYSECSSEREPTTSLSASATSSLIHSMEAAFDEALAIGQESLTNGDDQSVSEVSIGSADQSQTPAAEDPESGEKVRLDSAATNEEEEEDDQEETERAPDSLPNSQSDETKEESGEDNTDIEEKRANLTKMVKISLDEDSNETTSYSPTPHGEDSESVLEEKSLSALAVQVTRESVKDPSDKTEEPEEDGEKSKEEMVEDEKKEEKNEGEEVVVVATVDAVVESSPDVSVETSQVEEVKDGEKKEKTEEEKDKEEGESRVKDSEKPAQQPDVEQLTEQYKQLQQQFALLQQQLMMNSTSTPMNPAMAFQSQQMQQQMQQQIMLQQQMLLQQQQQQQSMIAPQHGGYVVVPQPGGGVIMSPPQMMYHPMGVPQVPVYGQIPGPPPGGVPSPEQAASVPAAKPGSDEADSPTKAEVKVESKDTKPVENSQEETPVKPSTETSSAPSGRRNVFADILKKKDSTKSAYVMSAAREAERQRSDSITSPTTKTSPSVSSDGSKSESRTEISANVGSPVAQDSSVSTMNGLSPTSSTTPDLPPLKVDTTHKPLPSLAAISPSSDSAPGESNNNLSKTTGPGVAEAPKADSAPSSPPIKVPPAIRPKPRQGPRPYRPVSMYAKMPSQEAEGEGSKFSTHARKVADLRSMFMAGK